MKVDPRLSLTIRELGDSTALVLATREALRIDEEVIPLLRASFDELADLARVPEAGRKGLRDRRLRGIFANGWQSWSYAGEIFGRERVKPAWLMTNVNLFVYRHGERDRRGAVHSHLFTHLRAGQGRLVLASRGPAPERSGAPIAFRVDRRTLDIEVEAFAGGTHYEAGAVVAELRLGWREGFFAERDFLKDIYSEHRHFHRLAFLENTEGLVPGGYESWYNHYTAITEKILGDDLRALVSNDNLINAYYLRRNKPTIFQIDDGWEEAVGDWEPHPTKFPGGMKTLATAIDEAGLIPGLWVAPFVVTRSSRAFVEKAAWLLRDRAGRPVPVGWNNVWDGDFYGLDLSIPEVEDWLDDLFRRIIDDWGYRYLKLDFLYTGFVEGRRGEGGAWEHYDRVVRRITNRLADSRGRRVAWLGCGAPLEPSYRSFPLMRIGADTRETWDYAQARLIRHQGRPAAKINLSHTIARSLLDGALFVNDPDVIFCRERGVEHGDREKELIAVVAKTLASQIMFSDDAADFGSPGEAAFTRRMVSLFDRLSRKEFGAERLARNVWTLFSRDGSLRGFINLRDRPYALRDEAAASFDPARALIPRAKRIAGGLLLEPRSVSLFET